MDLYGGSGYSSSDNGNPRRKSGVSVRWNANAGPQVGETSTTPTVSSNDTTPTGAGRGPKVASASSTEAAHRIGRMPSLSHEGSGEQVASHREQEEETSTGGRRETTRTPSRLSNPLQGSSPKSATSKSNRSDGTPNSNVKPATPDPFAFEPEVGVSPAISTVRGSGHGKTSDESANGVVDPAEDPEWRDWYQASDGYWYHKSTLSIPPLDVPDAARRPSDTASPRQPQRTDSDSSLHNPLNDQSTGSPSLGSPPSAANSSFTQNQNASQRAAGVKPSAKVGTGDSSGGSASDVPRDIKFRVIREVGRGAFGEVFLVMNILTGELMAAKQIRIDDGVSPKLIRDAEREINIMCRLPEHPNVVRYIGSQKKDKQMYIFMEYVSGGSVESLLRATKIHFHEATIQQYAFMVLLGLKHLHSNSIVHQDIKGANVLIDTNGIAKIADFGCCKDLSAMHLNSSKTTGSPLFMAPEVCRGEPADTRSDVWSFGCLMLEMAKDDRCPWSGFDEMSLFAVIYAISGAQKPPDIPTHLSPACRDFISRCLRIDPVERATIMDLLLHPFLQKELDEDDLEPTSASPAGAPSAAGAERAGTSPLRSESPPAAGPKAAPVAAPTREPVSKGYPSLADSQLLCQFSLRSTNSTYDDDDGAEVEKKPSTNPLRKGLLDADASSDNNSSPRQRASRVLGFEAPMTSPLLYGVDRIENPAPPAVPLTGAEPLVFHASGGGSINQGSGAGLRANPPSSGAGRPANLIPYDYEEARGKKKKKKSPLAKLFDRLKCMGY